MMERYLSVQRRAAEFYSRCGGEHVTYLQSEHDPNEWMEIHQYPSRATCVAVSNRLAQEPEMTALWDQFQATLDPYYPLMVDEYQQRQWLSPDQANNIFEDELAELLPDNES
jgi:hypothetical protein